MRAVRKRTLKAGLVLIGLLSAGLFFAYGVLRWGWHLVCVFNWITGWKCPGCGVSRMCLSLLRLDFEQAFYWNPAVMICLPALAYLSGYILVRYVRFGDFQMRNWQQNLCWGMISVLLVFGIARNL